MTVALKASSKSSELQFRDLVDFSNHHFGSLKIRLQLLWINALEFSSVFESPLSSRRSQQRVTVDAFVIM